jgi:hypothetical protein
MRDRSIVHSGIVMLGVVATLVALTGDRGRAVSVRGQARAVQSTVSTFLGSTSVSLADTGTLSDSSDAREASQGTGRVAGVFSGQTLHATTIGWPDQVTSEASVAGVSLSVAGIAIGADFVMSRAFAVAAGAVGATNIEGLSIAGAPVTVTGEPNQIIELPLGRIILNEQLTSSGGGITVNALHIIVSGIDVVVASATAGVQ